jgi:DNA-binding NtrC family response regulator
MSDLLALLHARLSSIIGELVDGGLSLAEASSDFERKYIAVSLNRSGGNLTLAAARMGVHRNTLHNKLRGHDDVPRRRKRTFAGLGKNPGKRGEE